MIDNEIFKRHVKTDSIIFIAYSGGVDSTALVHMCSKLKNMKVIALHVNHNLQTDSNIWQSHCIEQAKNFNIQIICKKLSPPKSLSNIEEWSRLKRYDFFKSVLESYENAVLMTAHHVEDQAETFIMNACRGSGIKGLQGILPQQKINSGLLIRPLITKKKKELINYCKSFNLKWIEDKSNFQNKFTRNYIRNSIIPKLEKKVPTTVNKLSECALWCQEAYSIITFFIQSIIKDVLTQDHLENFRSRHPVIDIKKLNSLNGLKKKYIIIHWLNYIVKIRYSSKQLAQILQSLKKGYGNWEYIINNNILRIEQHKLFICNSPRVQKKSDFYKNDTIFEWLTKQAIKTIINKKDIRLRNYTNKDKCVYPGRKHKNSIKILFQELKIPIKKRVLGRVVYNVNCPKKVIAIYPFFVCQN